MRIYPQEDHADLGLIDNDNTEQLVGDTREKEATPVAPGAPTPGGAVPNTQPLSRRSSRTMTVIADQQIPLPSGAEDDPDPWERATGACRSYRFIWSPPIPAPGRFGDDGIRCVVTQYDDGTIATEGDDRPLVYIDGGEGLTPAETRELAAALIAAADLADQWARVPR